jgi:hypothetical protein
MSQSAIHGIVFRQQKPEQEKPDPSCYMWDGQPCTLGCWIGRYEAADLLSEIQTPAPSKSEWAAPRNRWMGISRACLLALVPLAFLLGPGAPSASAQRRGPMLNDHELGGFITASFGDRPKIAVQLISEAGRGGPMLKSLRDLGAEVEFADEKVGYALALLPKDKLLDALDLPDLAFASAIVSDSNMYRFRPERAYVPPSERKPKPVEAISLPVSRVGMSLPKDGPYFAADEAGLLALWKKHPQADGRGVRVAVVDEGLDLLHPSVQLALDEDGKTVPKVADIMAFSDPAKSPSWIQFGEPMDVKGGSFTALGRTWMAPKDGSYRFGMYTNEFYLGLFRSWEKEQDPRLKKVSLSVGALWDETSNRVWVDTDGDGDFRNQRALGDYSATHDVDWFGRKEGETDNRIPFGVKIDRARKAVYLSIATGGHGALVAGPLAANRLTGGLFDGAAPNAQLIDVVFKPFWPALLSAFARTDVDVVNVSGGLGRPFEGGTDDFNRNLLTRALQVYKKPFAACAGAPNSFNVLDYAGPEMLRRNRQTSAPYVEYINGGVFFSPDGIVNTIIAPSAQLGTESRYLPYGFVSEDGKRYDEKGRLQAFAPPGYSIGANPSPTIPVVSGVVADIISEAKRQRIRYDGPRLTQAVLIGARRIPGISTSTQGYGVVNAAGAWEQLFKMASADDPDNPVLTSFTAARMDNGQHATVNGYNADILKAGGTLDDELWLTRIGGHEGGRDYLLSVRDDEGTYEILEEKVTFVRDRPERVRFKARLTSGLHVGFLQLRDAKAGVIMQEVPLSVRVPHTPKQLAPFVEKYHQTIPPRRLQYLYVRLEEDTHAARYVMRIPYVGMQDLFCGLPGNPRINNVAPSGEPISKSHHVGPLQNIEVVNINKRAETKVIYWSNRGSSEYENPSDPPAPDVPIDAELRVEKLALAFGKPQKQTIEVTNKQAAVSGWVEFHDAKLISTDVAGSGLHALATLDRELPANLSQWRVSLAGEAVGTGGVDAFLLDCTSKACSVAAVGRVRPSGATLVVEEPKAGKWRIVVRARGAIQKPLSYKLREALLTPSTAHHKEANHASGSSWRVAIPAGTGDAQYVAFIIAGKPFRILDDSGKGPAKYHFMMKAIGVPTYTPSNADMRIAMTSLTAGAP